MSDHDSPGALAAMELEKDKYEERRELLNCTAGLYAALAKAQGQIAPAVMDKRNPHFKSKFASLSSITASIRKPLSDNGLSVLQPVTQTVDGEYEVTTIIGHSGGGSLSFSFKVLLAKRDMQALGSAITYARRYALAAALGVVADEDDDGEAAVGREVKAGTVDVSQMIRLARNTISDYRRQIESDPVQTQSLDRAVREAGDDFKKIQGILNHIKSKGN